MAITTFHFFLFSLAVFRLTHLFVYDTITMFIRERFIQYTLEQEDDITIETPVVMAERGWRKWVGELLSCHWCMGIWCSALLLVGYLSFPFAFSILIIILASAAVAAILESIVIRWL